MKAFRRSSRSIFGIAAAALLSLPLTLAAYGAGAQEPAASLGGASSIQETYQDWQVGCSVHGNVKQCAMSQQQRQKANNQLVMAAQFVPGKDDGTASGAIIMPFGLLLSSGLTLQVDDKAASKPLPFRTCLPAGCLAPVSLDKATVSAARAGTTLKISAVASDTNQPVNLTISLKGFAQALDRLKTLLAA
jgi:invasion protein IalB